MARSEKPSPEKKKEWLENPKYWKWAGSIYFNPEDKRLLPPKRHPHMGWTVNFGNPYSVLLLLIFLAVVIWFSVQLREK